VHIKLHPYQASCYCQHTSSSQHQWWSNASV